MWIEIRTLEVACSCMISLRELFAEFLCWSCSDARHDAKVRITCNMMCLAFDVNFTIVDDCYQYSVITFSSNGTAPTSTPKLSTDSGNPDARDAALASAYRLGSNALSGRHDERPAAVVCVQLCHLAVRNDIRVAVHHLHDVYRPGGEHRVRLHKLCKRTESQTCAWAPFQQNMFFSAKHG